MRFEALEIEGAYLIHLDLLTDERGHFARTYCAEEFKEVGLDPSHAQSNISFNRSAGTLRGLHFQASPYEEAKLIRCTRGALFDVGVDIRLHSPSFKRIITQELRAGDGRMLFLPAGTAHGFLTLEDATEVTYQMSFPYVPGSERGIRWDDPQLAIPWPRPPAIISERDSSLPLLDLA